MSRNIPPVRTWRVRLYDDVRCFAFYDVDTINKRFARMLTWEKYPSQFTRAARVTVALSPTTSRGPQA